MKADLERLRTENRQICAERDALVKEMMKELEHLGGLEKELAEKILGEMPKVDMLVIEALEVSFKNIEKIAQISQKMEAKGRAATRETIDAYDEDIEMEFKFLDKKHETLAKLNAAISDKLQRIQDFQNKVNNVVKIEKEMEELLGRMETMTWRSRRSEQIIMDPNSLECAQCLIPPPKASTYCPQYLQEIQGGSLLTQMWRWIFHLIVHLQE